jgi:hypothetical protein
MPFGCESYVDGGGFSALRINRQGDLQVGRGKTAGNWGGGKSTGVHVVRCDGLTENEL